MTAQRFAPSLRSCRLGFVLVIALLLGLEMREWAYAHTEAVRCELNQQNAFYWGERIVDGEDVGSTHAKPGQTARKSFWQSYLDIYQTDEARPVAEPHQLDYVPLRLLMAGAWVKYLHTAYGPVREWRPEFARSFAAFSMVFEIAGAIAMFALVATVLKDERLAEASARPGRRWNRWEQAAAAAIVMWLNPAEIVDSHVWPHGQTWILPFYLFAILAMVSRRCFVAGAVFGLGSMFKGQMMLIAPMLVLWPMFEKRWAAALRVAAGMACGIGAIVWPWLMRGSMAWARIGFAAHVGFTDVLRKGEALNLPAVLDHYLHMKLHQQLINQIVPGLHLHLELRSLLIVIYGALLACCSRGIARQARFGDRRLLVSIAAPWAVMYFILGQMDERYIVWIACFSAAAIVINARSLAAHVMISFAGVATMFEFLLIIHPGISPSFLHALIAINPVVWLMTALSVAIFFIGSLREPRGEPEGRRHQYSATAAPDVAVRLAAVPRCSIADA